MDDQGSNHEVRGGPLTESDIPRFIDIHIHANVWEFFGLKGIGFSSFSPSRNEWRYWGRILWCTVCNLEKAEW